MLCSDTVSTSLVTEFNIILLWFNIRKTFTVVATQNDQTHMHFKPQLRGNLHTGFGFEDCKDSEK